MATTHSRSDLAPQLEATTAMPGSSDIFNVQRSPVTSLQSWTKTKALSTTGTHWCRWRSRWRTRLLTAFRTVFRLGCSCSAEWIAGASLGCTLSCLPSVVGLARTGSSSKGWKPRLDSKALDPLTLPRCSKSRATNCHSKASGAQAVDPSWFSSIQANCACWPAAY